MRRRPNSEIVARAQSIERMIDAACRPEERDRAQGLALLILGVETLESNGVDHRTIADLVQRILRAPVPDDPRSDTTGT